MSLRGHKSILTKFTERSKKKPLCEWKVVDKHRYNDSDGVVKELRLSSAKKIDNLPKLSAKLQKKKANPFELIFEASIILGPDNKRFLIDKINAGSVFEKELMVGDFIKSIDGDLIFPENVNEVLKRILTKKKFKIVAIQPNKHGFHSTQEEIKITKQLDLLVNKDKLFRSENEFEDVVFSLSLIVKQENSDSDDFLTVFSYPSETNFLEKLKGSFLTISSLLTSTFGEPKMTVLKVNDETFFVSYTNREVEKEILFLGFNSSFTNKFDVQFHTANIVKYLDFVYPNFSEIEDFQRLSMTCELLKIQLLQLGRESVNFEQLFSCPTFAYLPKEIVLRINDSLSELEAMDYRNWNESLVDLFGKFNILGTCLYYKNSLICTHFNEIEMENVEVFLRTNCLQLLYDNCLVNEITLWQRVYPKKYQSFNKENDSSKNKVFIAVAGRAELLLVTMLEENEYNFNPDIETQSSNYLIHFVEEMNDVLDHLSFVGIENLTRIWISSSKRPQCKKLQDAHDKDRGFEENSIHLKSLKEEDEESVHDHESQLGSQKSSSGFEMNDLTDMICKDFAAIIPQTITFGKDRNVLYHFTQIDLKEGKIITVNEKNFSDKSNVLSEIFKRECIRVHKMLQNTIKFDQMLSKENTKISQKSTTMMQIKEKGVVITFNLNDEEHIEFWIVGRLFQSIYGARELFVCYDSIVPQNIVEIAFRIGLNCVG